MASVFDVAKYILEKQHPMTTMKLEKLVYYSQTWSVVWDESLCLQKGLRLGQVALLCVNYMMSTRGCSKFMAWEREIQTI